MCNSIITQSLEILQCKNIKVPTMNVLAWVLRYTATDTL